MGNGCSCVDQNMLVERIKIRRHRYNSNKIFLDLNLQFCKEYSIGPYFLTTKTSNLNFQTTSFLLKKIGYITKSLNNQNIMDSLDYKEIYSFDTIYFIKENLKDKVANTSSVRFINSNIFRPIFYYILLLDRASDTGLSSAADNQLLLRDNNDYELDQVILGQIKCDLHRTFPSFKVSKDELFISNLNDALVTISHQDKELSYVQGLNFIVAFLLMLLGNDKHKSVELFSAIMNTESKLYHPMKYKGTHLNLI
jgi:hypothetical protein